MKFYELRSGQRTVTATTDTWTSESIQGAVKKIEYIVSGTMNVKANSLREDGSTADEYLTGGVSASLSCPTGKTNCYPVRHNTAISDNSAYVEGTNADASRCPVVINSPVQVTGTLTSTTSGTWEAIVTYEK